MGSSKRTIHSFETIFIQDIPKGSTTTTNLHNVNFPRGAPYIPGPDCLGPYYEFSLGGQSKLSPYIIFASDPVYWRIQKASSLFPDFSLTSFIITVNMRDMLLASLSSHQVHRLTLL